MTTTPEDVVRAFFTEVRSGRNPARAVDLMTPIVLAHQFTAEAPLTVERTPQNYAEHIRDMQSAFGSFTVEISEFLAHADRVYVRWVQTGVHRQEYDGFAPTGLPITEFASAVYRVSDGKIAEYWIQVDRAGVVAQLERNARLIDEAPRVKEV